MKTYVYVFLNKKKLLLWTSMNLKIFNRWKNSRPYNDIKSRSNYLRADYQRPNTLMKICLKSRPKTMDEIRVLELHFSFLKKKKRKKGRKRLTYKISSSVEKGIVLNVCRRREGASVVLNIHVLWTFLEEKACSSTKVELYNTEVKIREILKQRLAWSPQT